MIFLIVNFLIANIYIMFSSKQTMLDCIWYVLVVFQFTLNCTNWGLWLYILILIQFEGFKCVYVTWHYSLTNKRIFWHIFSEERCHGKYRCKLVDIHNINHQLKKSFKEIVINVIFTSALLFKSLKNLVEKISENLFTHVWCACLKLWIIHVCHWDWLLMVGFHSAEYEYVYASIWVNQQTL